MKAGIIDSVASGDDAGGSRNSASEHNSSHNSSVYLVQTSPSDAVVDRRSHSITESPTLNDSGGDCPKLNTRRPYHKLGQQHQPQQQKSSDRQDGAANDSATANTRPSTIEPVALDQSMPSLVMSPPVTSFYANAVVEKDDSQQGAEKSVSDSAHPSTRPSAWRLWPSSMVVLAAALCGIGFLFLVGNSMVTRPFDTKNCRMSYMRPSYIKFHEFDTEHTRYATKYSLYLYREQGVDYGEKLRGIPILFVPGNAGSYKQVRPIAAEAATYIVGRSDVHDAPGVLNLDFFTVDFNEDITAFHGQTLLDQAEYLNEAVRYILSLYMDPDASGRERDYPDPSSVIILGHSMGGVVARTMLIMPNYQANSINTILTMSAPHARPPVTFDGQIVQLYDQINGYWRQAHSQKWANDNPLWHVTLVSIAGGGLDTVVPSDYASIESLAPETHGFTVFTTTIPFVWTSMDHQAILWCDQFRKVIIRALYGIVDARRASQTKPRAERMRILRRHFLTGMENDVEKGLAARRPSTMLTISDMEVAVVPREKSLVLSGFGRHEKPTAFLVDIPLLGPPGERKFALLTDAPLGLTGSLHPDARGGARVEVASGSGGFDAITVLVCSTYLPSYQPYDDEVLPPRLHHRTDVPGWKDGSSRLMCKTVAPDFSSIPIPSSGGNARSGLATPRGTQLSYLEYDLKEMADQQFVVVLDMLKAPSPHFMVAEFPYTSSMRATIDVSIWTLIHSGVQWTLPQNHSFVHETIIPVLRSSLLAYRLNIIVPTSCRQGPGHSQPELFSPIVRQHLSQPYSHESKYHAVLHGRSIGISIHGEAPFLPPPSHISAKEGGLAIQLWMDPNCKAEITASLSLDFWGSIGLLYMRYRTVLAAFPLLVTALVLCVQFWTYDATGVFVSFANSLDACLRGILPALLLILTIISASAGAILSITWSTPQRLQGLGEGVAALDSRSYQADILTGTGDPVFWFIIPLIGAVSVGVCTALHYLILALTTILSFVYRILLSGKGMAGIWGDDSHPPEFAPSSPRRRLVTTGTLLLLVSTFIPYQFAYLVACMVQVFTTVRALCLHLNADSVTHTNFYNYAHSVLLLMMWILPINLPILAVWIRNLSVHWLTPFSSHHNVWSIMPFIVLVENLTGGSMIPRLPRRMGHITAIIFVGIAVYAATYGVSRAYNLHHLANLASTWLVLIHFTSQPWSFYRFGVVTQSNRGGDSGKS